MNYIAMGNLEILVGKKAIRKKKWPKGSDIL